MKKNIYVKLLNEGTICYRPVEAIEIEAGKYQITEENDTAFDEEWEFPAGTIVNVEEHTFSDNSTGLLAIRYIDE